MTFSKPSFKCPEGIWKELLGRDPVHPFVLDRKRNGSRKTLYQPDDPRLDLSDMLLRKHEYLTNDELDEASRFGHSQIIRVGVWFLVERRKTHRVFKVFLE